MRKLIRFWLFIKHRFYYLSCNRIGSYLQPDENVKEIGFIDDDFLVSVKEEYKHLFSKKYMSPEADPDPFKSGKITLYYDGSNILVRKKFSGRWMHHDFYNEIYCLDRLKDSGSTPAIRYINYKSCEIYMDFIEGVVLSKVDNSGLEEVNLKKTLDMLIKNIHINGIIVNDFRSKNLIYDPHGDLYIYDFSDAIYRRGVKLYFMDSLFEDLKRQDIKRLETIVRNLYNKFSI